MSLAEAYFMGMSDTDKLEVNRRCLRAGVSLEARFGRVDFIVVAYPTVHRMMKATVAHCAMSGGDCRK